MAIMTRNSIARDTQILSKLSNLIEGSEIKTIPGRLDKERCAERHRVFVFRSHSLVSGALIGKREDTV